MAPSKKEKKEAAKLELAEDEERFPRLNDTNRSEYEIVAEIDNDLQAMVDQGVLGPDDPVDVARNVFLPHGQGTHKTTGDRLILLWYGFFLGGSSCMVKNEGKGRKMTGFQRHRKIVVLLDITKASQTNMAD